METAQRMQPGDTRIVVLPFSEVCMFLGVAGQECPVTLLDHGMAQLLDARMRPLSFPILASEAGIHRDDVAGAWYALEAL